MVNITQCAVCGRTIPANGKACAYCERDRGPDMERPYLPLAVRLLLVLFGVDLVATLAWSALAGAGFLGAADDPLAAAPSLLRLTLAAAALGGLLAPRPWGWWTALAFVCAEILGGTLALLKVVPPSVWAGPLMAPLWTVLFAGMLLRGDVRARYDMGVADRREVDDLLRSLDEEEP